MTPLPPALLRLLLTPKLPLGRYCLLVVPVAIIPSALLYAIAFFAAEATGFNASAHSAPSREFSAALVFGSVFLAPFVETLLLVGLLKMLSSSSLSAVACATIAALVAGVLHGLAGALWFFGTAWTFFVLSCAYLAWRRVSFAHAFIAACVPHALVNAVVMIAVAAQAG